MPRVVHCCASLELPRLWSLCLEGLYANDVLHLSSGLASRDRALVCSGSSCFRRHPSQVINLSTDTIVPAAVPAASCLGLAVSASASGARSRRSSVRVVSALASAYDTRSRSCSRCVLAVCLVVSGHQAHPAPRPVAAREYTHREALRKDLCSPRCSSRTAPVALITKKSLLTILCTLSL